MIKNILQQYMPKKMLLPCMEHIPSVVKENHRLKSTFGHMHMCHGQARRVLLGMVIPPLIGILIMGI